MMNGIRMTESLHVNNLDTMGWLKLLTIAILAPRVVSEFRKLDTFIGVNNFIFERKILDGQYALRWNGIKVKTLPIRRLG